MIEEMIQSGGMRKKAQKGSFALYTHLRWAGRLVLGDADAHYRADALDLCPELDLGSVSILLDGDFGLVADARADHGDQAYLKPGRDQRLLLATVNPVEFTPKALEAIASAMIGGDDVLKLPEVQSANARHFIARLHEMGIGDPSERIL